MTHKSKPLTENVTFCPLGLKVFFWEIFRLEDFVFEIIFRRPSDHFVPSVPPLASWACPPEKLIKPDRDKTFEFRPLIICLPIQSWAYLSFLLTINHAPCSVLVGWSWNWGKINAKWLIPSPFLLVRFIQGSKPLPAQDPTFPRLGSDFLRETSQLRSARIQIHDTSGEGGTRFWTGDAN